MNELEKATMLRAVSEAAKTQLPKGWGVIIIAVPFGQDITDVAEYCSNLKRDDAVEIMRQTADRVERNMPKGN